jgi:uncharacterized lipoprotein YddW (UPF0748 family)
MSVSRRTLILAAGLVLVILCAAPAVAQEPAPPTIYLYRDGQATPVVRPTTLGQGQQADADRLLEALLAGPLPGEQSQGYSSPFPPGAELAGVRSDGEEVVVDLSLPPSYLRQELDPDRSDAMVELIVKTLHPLGLHRVHVRARNEEGDFLPLSDFFSRPSIIPPSLPPNDDSAPDRLGPVSGPPPTEPEIPGQPPAYGQGRPQGALSGKTVWLSAGHGWYWSSTLNRWTTQRGNNHGLVEDFSNAEAVNYYLARYLWNAGADVWFVRERAMTTHEVIVDNDRGAPFYTETGTWQTSSTPGYEGGSYRWTSTFSSRSATATWTPELPEAGWYAVWVWYRHGANRPTEARYEIRHAGGATTAGISQEVHGLTWRYLGEYYFQAGSAGSVTLLNSSSDAGQAVIADAVRFGGGRGTMAEPGGPSRKPRWEEAAKYWARYQGAPAEISLYDASSRPLYAEWETAKGYPGDAGDSIYISWHTNAGGGTGTDSFIHITHPVAGSVELQNQIHTELIRDLRSGWDPGWVDRGRKRADFSEVRELSTIPGVLLEIAFHDTEDPGDADDLREPVFRQIAARAAYQGAVKYFAGQEGRTAYLVPEPPTRLAARNRSSGRVTLTWAPPPCCDGLVGDAATSYKVYQSTNGQAFDNGTETPSPSLTLTNVPAGKLLFLRVTALNAGGESFPTPVVAVRTPATGKEPDFLIVDGFDRLDQSALVPQWESSALGTDRRMFLERMNRYDYAVEHGQGLGACGLAFDGATNEAVEHGDVILGDYAAVDWFTGEDSASDAALSNTERVLLAAYLDGGGKLLISGAEIGYDLVERGGAPSFYGDYLQARYVGDDAGSYGITGVPGGPFEGLAGTFDDGNGQAYHVEHADLLGAIPSSKEVLRYTGSPGGGAAVAHDGRFRLLHFGFPLETVNGADTRAALFCAAARYLLPQEEPPEPSCSQRMINPGFEGGQGQTAWKLTAPAGVSVLANRDDLPGYLEPHSGDWLAQPGHALADRVTTTELSQEVGLPSGEPGATLSLAWYVHREDDSLSSGDSLSLGVYDLDGVLLAELGTITKDSPADAWQVSRFDLGAFAGNIVRLSIRASSRASSFFIDDVSLTTCGSPGPDEYRALWVDAYHDGIKSRQQIDELIETARAGNFNALILQVRRRGDTYYPSSIDPWAPDAVRGFDALAYAIERAHTFGIEVHAWATTLAIWGGDTPTTAPDHVFNQHGRGTSGRDYWLATSSGGEELPDDGVYYLDPGHPDAVDYTVAVYAELASRYALDGLHLDRVRYPWQNWGYNPTALARFQAQTGRKDRPDPDDAEWLQWRRDQVTALVRRVYLVSTSANPRLRVSAALSAAGSPPGSSAPWQTRTPYTHQLQDWQAWLEEGILDLGVPMIYRDEDTSAGEFDGWIEWVKDHQSNRGVLVGSALYLNAVEESIAQWRRARLPSKASNRALGISGYSYATPSDDGAQRRDLANLAVTGVFTQPASTASIPWKDDPALGHLMGTLTPSLACRPPLDGQTLTLSGPETRTMRADASGWFGAVDLPPGQYLLTTKILTPSRVINVPLTVVPGTVTEQPVVLPGCETEWENLYLPLVRKH